MTSHPSLPGTQRYHASKPARGVQHTARQLTRNRVESSTLTPGQIPVIDLTDGDIIAYEVHLQPKHQKVDYSRDASMITSPTSTLGSITRTNRLKGPSARKPGWTFEEHLARYSEESTSQDWKPKDDIFKNQEEEELPPLPSHPWAFTSGPERQKPKVKENTTLPRGKVPQIPFVFEMPLIAPQYRRNKPTDFSPWTGETLEDTFNDQVIKTGFYDKIKVSNDECSTARPIIYRNLKHKAGLQNLSILLSAALQQRDSQGRVIEPSSFKPPPRVTLTDSRREAWLRDLASPVVPLRRLSRTIPHGIRGKGLLDHCLSKSIPIARAVWLARCVGANEIRAFRRKGASGTFVQGGDAKWIRDWTICVEQSVENAISCCGSNDWRTKIQYTLKLATHLYFEHLVDQDHYLEWLLVSFERSSDDKLPVWLLLLRIYWKELSGYRKYNRSLSEILLQKLLSDSDRGEGILAPIMENISHLVEDCLRLNPWSFIVSNSWDQYREVLGSGYLDIPFLHLDLSKLSARNLSLIPPVKTSTTPFSNSLQQHLIQILDTCRSKFDLATVSSNCLVATPDHNLLVKTLLEWASTSYREGHARVYLASRLLLTWQRLDINIDDGILSFLSLSNSIHGLRKKFLYQTLGETIASKCFSAGRYLQWVTARGGLRELDDLKKSAEGFVSELPIECFPPHILNLRNSLLRRVGFSVYVESSKIMDIEALLASKAPDILGPPDPNPSATLVTETSLSHLSYTIRSAVTSWVKHRVLSQIEFHTNRNTAQESVSLALSPIYREQCWSLCNALECLEDFSALAALLSLISYSTDPVTLGCVADTINLHFDIFLMMGIVEDLSQKLLSQFLSLKGPKPISRISINSALSLSLRFPGHIGFVRCLYHMITPSDRRPAALANSPVSDSMTETVQHSDYPVQDEIDQLLMTGTRADERVLMRSFEMMVPRFVTDLIDYGKFSSSSNDSLSKLRAINARVFDNLISSWLEKKMTDPPGLSLPQIVMSLVGAGCLSLDVLVSSARRVFDRNLSTNIKYQLAMDILSIVFQNAPKNKYSSLLCYRCRLAQQKFINLHPDDVIFILRKWVETSIDVQECSKDRFGSLLQDIPSIKGVLRQLIISSGDRLFNDFVQPLLHRSQDSFECIISLLSNTLESKEPTVFSTSNTCLAIRRVLQKADYISLPFCKFELRVALDPDSRHVKKDSSSYGTSIRAIYEVMRSSSSSTNTLWMELVSGLDQRVASQIREYAEVDMLSAYPSTPSSQVSVPNLISIFDTVAYSVPESGFPRMRPVLADKARLISGILPKGDCGKFTLPCDMSADPAETSYDLGPAMSSLQALLHLIIAHMKCFSNTHNSNATGNKNTHNVDFTRHLLISLVSVITIPCVACYPYISASVFDVAALLVDNMPPESRLHCSRLFKEHLVGSDPHLRFLFGYHEESIGWLQIQQKGFGKTMPYVLKRWEILEEPTPYVGNNDTALSLGLFNARRA
ncbi:MAG: RNA polymerase II mediator complex subunit [Cirrosporium novae-zelandiae]|nr:MAG: RNA polymerase II mediator complex subunit [Cirrosporium novae-zelandiae]